MKNFLLFTFIAAFSLTAWQGVLAQTYHFQEGFGSTPDGWTLTNTFLSSVNHGDFEGDKSVKMKGDTSFIETPAFSTAEELSYWVEARFEGATLLVEKSTDGGYNWLEIDSYTVTTYDLLQFLPRTVFVNDDSPMISFKFTVIGSPGGTEAVMYIDDMSLSKIATGSNNATLGDITADSMTIDGFLDATTDYIVELPFGTVEIPVVEAVPNSSGATVVITQATDINGDAAARTATITVTSEDASVTQVYTLVFTINEYFVQYGFGNEGGARNELQDYGWDVDRVYISTSVKVEGAPNILPGDAAMKFTGGHSSVVDDPLPGFLLSPRMKNVGTLSFWYGLEKEVGGEALIISMITDNGTVEIWRNDYLPLVFEELVLEINSEDSIQILIESICDINDDSESRIWLDDFQLKGFDPTVSIGDFAASPSVSVYPNPSDGILNFNFPENAYQKVEVYNVTGQRVFERSVEFNQSSLNLKSLNKGIYMISFSGDAGKYTSKFIKE